MSKRIDKKRMKRQAEITSAPRDIKAPAAKEAENIDFYIQYQGQEYLEREIIERIKERCKVEGNRQRRIPGEGVRRDPPAL